MRGCFGSIRGADELTANTRAGAGFAQWFNQCCPGVPSQLVPKGMQRYPRLCGTDSLQPWRPLLLPLRHQETEFDVQHVGEIRSGQMVS